MRRRVLVAYLVLTALVLIVLEVPLAVSLGRRERDARSTVAQRDASALAALSEEGIEHPVGHDLTALAARYAAHSDATVTIVDGTGSVVATASGPGHDEPERMYSKEVAAALAGRPSSGVHHDDSGTRRYVATPIGSGTTVLGAVVVTYPSGPIERKVHRLWAALAALAAAVLVIAFVVGDVVARSVAEPLSRLDRTAAALGHGDLHARAVENDGPEEVRELASTFNEMADRLAGLVDAQRRFVADVSHQLRTPLTALRLRLEGMDADGPESAADLDAAVREVHRLSRLVDGLLQLARVENATTERQAVDVAEVVDQRRVAWAPLADERGLVLRVDARHPDGTHALAVPGALDQVLDNVLANAIEASPPGAAVTISVTPGADGVDLCVADEGPGMPPDQRARAFDRFSHGHAGRAGRAGGGTGLGLAIVRQLVVASGGRVELHDSDSGGLKVQIHLQSASAASSDT